MGWSTRSPGLGSSAWRPATLVFPRKKKLEREAKKREAEAAKLAERKAKQTADREAKRLEQQELRDERLLANKEKLRAERISAQRAKVDDRFASVQPEPFRSLQPESVLNVSGQLANTGFQQSQTSQPWFTVRQTSRPWFRSSCTKGNSMRKFSAEDLGSLGSIRSTTIPSDWELEEGDPEDQPSHDVLPEEFEWLDEIPDAQGEAIDDPLADLYYDDITGGVYYYDANTDMYHDITPTPQAEIVTSPAPEEAPIDDGSPTGAGGFNPLWIAAGLLALYFMKD